MNHPNTNARQAFLVKTYIIDPLNVLCGYQQIDVKKSPFYVDALCRFDETVLRAAMEEIAKIWEKNIPPQPAEIAKICMKVEESNHAKRAHEFVKPREDMDALKARIFATEQGKEALRLGVAHSFYIQCLGGKKPQSFTKQDFVTFREARQQNIERVEKIKQQESIETWQQSVLSMWEKMQRFEQELQQEMTQSGVAKKAYWNETEAEISL